MGVTILSKGMSVRGVLKTLRGNGGMAILIDQDSGRNGIFVDYFGRLCSTPRGPALFALKTGAALVYVSSVRGDDGVITCAFEDIEIDYEREIPKKISMPLSNAVPSCWKTVYANIPVSGSGCTGAGRRDRKKSPPSRIRGAPPGAPHVRFFIDHHHD